MADKASAPKNEGGPVHAYHRVGPLALDRLKDAETTLQCLRGHSAVSTRDRAALYDVVQLLRRWQLYGG
jgi:hypothetical protein